MSDEAAASEYTPTTLTGLRPALNKGPCVARVGRALAVVPSPGPASKAWKRLGFSVSGRIAYLGCTAFDVILADGGIRFLAPATRKPTTQLSALVSDRLVMGAGLLGWSWACKSVDESRQTIEDRSGRSFPLIQAGRKTVVVPPELNPGASTLLEPLAPEKVPAHANHVVGLDHMVLAVSDTDGAADAYMRYFGLSAKRKTIAERRYAVIELGRGDTTTLEIVGPTKPERGPLSGHCWGLAFRSADLDATVAMLREGGVNVRDPHVALQGGRIASLPMQLGGIHIAFLGA